MLKLKQLSLIAVLIFSLVFLVSGIVSAQPDEWKFNVDIYGWYTDIGGETASGSDIDYSASNIMDDLKMTFMAGFGARKNKWSFQVDVVYLNVESDSTTKLLKRNVEVEMKDWIVTSFAGYTFFESDRARVDFIAGARLLSLDIDVEIGNFINLSDNKDFWDGIIGIRGEFNLNDKWYVPFYGDIGTGDSDFTWQALAGIGYRFERFDIIAAYRYIDWELDNTKAIDSLDVSGPLLGFRIRF